MLAKSPRPILLPLPLVAHTDSSFAVSSTGEREKPSLYRGAEFIGKLKQADDVSEVLKKLEGEDKDAKFLAKHNEICEAIATEFRNHKIKAAGEKNALRVPPANEPLLSFRTVVPPEGINLEEAVDKAVWVNRCLNIIAENVASVPLRVMRRKGGVNGTDAGEPDFTSPPALELQRLLERPNAHQSGTDIIEAISIWMNVRQCLLWMMWEPKRSDTKFEEAKKLPDALYCLPAHRSIGMMKEGALYYWRVSSIGLAIPNWQVIRMGYYNPKEEFRGLSPLSAAFQSADTDYATELFYANKFDRGLLGTGFVSIDKENLSDDARKRYESFFKSLSGVGNAFAIGAIDAKAKFESLASDAKDMEYEHLGVALKRKIAGSMGVPMFMLGEPDAGGKISANVARRSFWQDRLLPHMRKIEDSLNLRLVPYAGDPDLYLQFDISKVEALSEDKTEFATAFYQISQGITLNVSAGVMSPEDGSDLLREKFGMEVEGVEPEDDYSEEEEVLTENSDNQDEDPDLEGTDSNETGDAESKAMAKHVKVPVIRKLKDLTMSRMRLDSSLGFEAFPVRRAVRLILIDAAARKAVVTQAVALRIAKRIQLRVAECGKDRDKVAAYFDRLEKAVAK